MDCMLLNLIKPKKNLNVELDKKKIKPKLPNLHVFTPNTCITFYRISKKNRTKLLNKING